MCKQILANNKKTFLIGLIENIFILFSRLTMNKQLLILESLPNEILLDLYEYFDIRELYQSFYNLNHRFNFLLQSLSHLSLYYQTPNDNYSIDFNMIFSSRVYTINIYSQNNLELKQFYNLHRLIIWFPTDEQIIQINTESFPYLEYLSVSFTITKSSICSLYQKIFSNGFPLLKSCFLSGCESPTNTTQWIQSPNLRYLNTTSNYPSILAACPNLYSLNLKLTKLYDISFCLKPHFHLKRLRLILTSIIWLENEKNFENLFLSIPTIEQFFFHKLFSITNSIDLLYNYDWLSRILNDYLPLLKEFTYHLYIINLFHIDQTDIEKNLFQIKENFSRIYNNQLKFNLQIKLDKK